MSTIWNEKSTAEEITHHFKAEIAKKNGTKCAFKVTKNLCARGAPLMLMTDRCTLLLPVVITGVTIGTLGYEVARVLALYSSKVYCIGRNKQRYAQPLTSLVISYKDGVFDHS
jgi:hypothetical protein